MRFHAGDRVDHYTLLEPLGEGGQGSVWKVLDPRDGGVVRALKLVALAETGSAAFDRTRREARILAAAQHPALVTCHGLFEDPRTGIVGLVMDLVSGRTLADAASEERFHRGRALAALAQIADALAYVHKAGLAHRDLKPENVIVTEGFWDEPHRPGAVKLVDFGIAAPTSNPSGLTSTGMVIGTLPYLSPELVDPASWGKAEGSARDLFAFGVMAYQLLCGKHPTGLGPNATMVDYARAYKAAEAGRIPWPPPGLDGVAGAAVIACLSLRAARRPADGAALVELMRSGAAQSGTTLPHRESARPAGAAPTLGKTVESRVAGGVTPRTVPQAPLPGALAPLVPPPPARKRDGGWGLTWLVFLVAMLAVGAGVRWSNLFEPSSNGAAVTPAPGPEEAPAPLPSLTTKPAIPPTPTTKPAMPPTPTAQPMALADVDACRQAGHDYDGLSSYPCPFCVGDPPQIPRNATWWVRIHGVTPPKWPWPGKPDEICTSLDSSSSSATCIPYTQIRTRLGVSARLQATTKDIESGHVVFDIRDHGRTLAKGNGITKAKDAIHASALCSSLPLYLDDPDHPGIIISVFLDDH